jgi:hypothetical protein
VAGRHTQESIWNVSEDTSRHSGLATCYLRLGTHGSQRLVEQGRQTVLCSTGARFGRPKREGTYQMTTSGEDAVRATWDLYNVMTTDLAAEHANAEFNGVAADDGWDDLADQVAAAQSQLNELAHEKSSRGEHRHARAVKEALGELYNALVERSASALNYLTVEAQVKKVIADGGSGDMVRLDQARNRLDKANQRMTSDRSSLLYDLENLNADVKGS